MTLVVARLVGDGCLLIGDLKVTNQNALTTSPLRGALKLTVVDKSTCIAFAGTVVAGQDAIRPAVQSGLRGTELLDHLLAKHLEHNGSVDFLVATLLPKPSLTRISGGAPEPGLTAGWIGNPQAYNVYQAHYHKPLFAQLDDVFKMMWAFEQVIDDSSIPSVDRPAIAVQTFRGDFRYAPMTVARPPASATRLLELGNAASGGYTSSIWAPLEPGIAAVGIHFYQGNLGVLYYPAQSDEAFVFPNVTQEQFREAVLQRHGILIDGNEINP